jgi:hypothetical protein
VKMTFRLFKRDGLWKLVNGEERMPSSTASDTPAGVVQRESGEGEANVGTIINSVTSTTTR